MRQCRCFRVSRLKKILSLVMIILSLGYFGFKTSRPVLHLFVNEYASLPCNLPVLDPFDSSIKDFFWKPEPIKCFDFPSIVFIDENNVLNLNESALEFFGLKSSNDVMCSSESIYRRGDDYHVGFNLPKDLKLPASLDTDFNRVTCKSRSGTILFKNVIAGISSKPGEIEQKIAEESEEQLSVLMFGLDSVSRSASVRCLPKTLEILRELGCYDFRGMMKNGENTISNVIAQLSGIKLWSDSEFIGFENDTLDKFPLLWKKFSKKDYVTLFAEDLPHIGMFNYAFKGFKGQPTDHYMRPFWLAIGKAKTLTHSTASVLKFLEDSGIKLTKSALCNQNTINHVEVINYIKRFILHYKTKRKFVYSFITELAHRFDNFLCHADEDIKDLILWMKDMGFLNRTVVVLFGDHGSRFDTIRNTFVGRMESRMPMLYVLLPEHIKRKFPNVDKSLTMNTHRLTSHYDVYQTMVDILDKNFRNPSVQIYKGVKRGISLFREISSSRSCVEAQIPADFCACYKSTPLNVTNNENIRTIADEIVNHLNELLKKETECKVLTLNRILYAQKMSQGLKYIRTKHNEYSFDRFFKPEQSRDSYIVTIETVPGYGTFETSCEIEANGKPNCNKNIDRTNKYGNQSWCVSDRILKQYCYC